MTKYLCCIAVALVGCAAQLPVRTVRVAFDRSIIQQRNELIAGAMAAQSVGVRIVIDDQNPDVVFLNVQAVGGHQYCAAEYAANTVTLTKTCFALTSNTRAVGLTTMLRWLGNGVVCSGQSTLCQTACSPVGEGAAASNSQCLEGDIESFVPAQPTITEPTQLDIAEYRRQH